VTSVLFIEVEDYANDVVRASPHSRPCLAEGQSLSGAKIIGAGETAKSGLCRKKVRETSVLPLKTLDFKSGVGIGFGWKRRRRGGFWAKRLWSVARVANQPKACWDGRDVGRA